MTHKHHTALPLYRSHKLVRAAKINDVQHDPGAAFLQLEGGHSIEVDADWLQNRVYGTGNTNPAAGYFVVYDNGHTSWSPASAFEGGHTQLDDEDLELLAMMEEHKGALDVPDDGAIAGIFISRAEDHPVLGRMVVVQFARSMKRLNMPAGAAWMFAQALADASGMLDDDEAASDDVAQAAPTGKPH